MEKTKNKRPKEGYQVKANVSPARKKQFSDLAERMGETESVLLRRALDEYLERNEKKV